MADLPRGLLRPLLAALIATLLLVFWIRGEPLDLPYGLQTALCLALVGAEAALLLVVLRRERGA